MMSAMNQINILIPCNINDEYYDYWTRSRSLIFNTIALDLLNLIR